MKSSGNGAAALATLAIDVADVERVSSTDFFRTCELLRLDLCFLVGDELSPLLLPVSVNVRLRGRDFFVALPSSAGAASLIGTASVFDRTAVPGLDMERGVPGGYSPRGVEVFSFCLIRFAFILVSSFRILSRTSGAMFLDSCTRSVSTFQREHVRTYQHLFESIVNLFWGG